MQMKRDSKDDKERRSGTRTEILVHQPVYLEANLDGAKVSMLLENLSEGGATVIYPADSGALEVGRHIEGCVLNIPEVARLSVSPIIRWRVWPKLGLQFDGISDEDRRQITSFLQKVQ
jgi:c-di-GMP-binding flagellar brake protein YcgR